MKKKIWKALFSRKNILKGFQLFPRYWKCIETAAQKLKITCKTSRWKKLRLKIDFFN